MILDDGGDLHQFGFLDKYLSWGLENQRALEDNHYKGVHRLYERMKTAPMPIPAISTSMIRLPKSKFGTTKYGC